jgi:sugar-specific transcriptional regulator TrmB
MEEKINLLKDLGLTEYEAKIYLALLYLKKADTRTIAKETKILQTKAYQVAKKLIERGFLKMMFKNLFWYYWEKGKLLE